MEKTSRTVLARDPSENEHRGILVKLTQVLLKFKGQTKAEGILLRASLTCFQAREEWLPSAPELALPFRVSLRPSSPLLALDTPMFS